MIAAATHRNCVATITTTFGEGRMSCSVFRQRDSNLGQCFTRFAASAGCFNRGKSEAGSSCVGPIDEWHVDLRKPKGGSDMGQAGLPWEDGGWQPLPHRQGGPRCAILTEVPFAIR